jgi:hypothetical protein
MKNVAFIVGVALLLTAAGCFQTVDNAAALKAGTQMAPPSDPDAGSGGPFPIMIDTPPIALPDGTTTTDPCTANQAWSLAILKQDCASCHEAPNDVGLPPWDFVLEPDKLTTTVDTRTNMLFVAPGDPDHSRVFQRIANNEMPPPPNSSVAQALPRPTLSDISVLRAWIICLGGPSTGTGGAGGTTGTAGTGGTTGAAGAGGTTGAAGTGGTTGTAGTGGTTGAAGTTGVAGTTGTAGTTGAAGTTGGAGGKGGAGGAAGAAGAGGAGGAAGTGAAGRGGAGGAGGRGGAGGAGGRAGAGGAGGRAGGGGGDPARYNFETSVQGWQNSADSDVAPFTSITVSTAQHFAGASSLAATIAATGATKYSIDVLTPTPPPGPGAVVTFHVFIPTGSLVDWTQPYVLDSNGSFTGFYVGSPTQGAWNLISVTVPSSAATVNRMGVQFHTSGTWNGTVYVDSVNW